MKIYFLPLLAMIGALALPAMTHATELGPGQFIRSSNGTVYWIAENERRYVFPDGATLQSWLGGTPGMLNAVQDNNLEQFPVGGPMTMRPGTRLVRFDSDPTTYVVTRGAVLRKVTETLAGAYYGVDWEQNVDVLSIALFPNYKIGKVIEYVSDFDRIAETNAAPTPEADLAFRRTNGLLPSSTAPLKATIKTSVEPETVLPPDQPTLVTFRVQVTNPNTEISNLRTDIFRENGPWIRACLGIDLCVQDIDYRMVTKAIDDRFYAIVSNDRGESLPAAYSPLITVRPVQVTP
jgi:hypothetical protein